MSKKKQTSDWLTESCKLCKSTDFSISIDASQTRYCSKCPNVWLPKSEVEIKLEASEEKVFTLQSQLSAYQKETNRLKNQIKILEKQLRATNPSQKTLLTQGGPEHSERPGIFE